MSRSLIRPIFNRCCFVSQSQLLTCTYTDVSHRFLLQRRLFRTANTATSPTFQNRNCINYPNLALTQYRRLSLLNVVCASNTNPNSFSKQQQALLLAQNRNRTMELTQRLFTTSGLRLDDDKDEKKKKKPDLPDTPPDGLVKKFKWYWKKYWYVVIPVHIATSTVWFGTFYFVAYSGVDIVALMQTLMLPDSAVHAVQKLPAAAGDAAVAYLLYKIASPARYSVTIGCTVYSIRVLRSMGVLPTANEVRGEVSDYVKDKHDDVKDYIRSAHMDYSAARKFLRERRARSAGVRSRSPTMRETTGKDYRRNSNNNKNVKQSRRHYSC